MKKAKLRRRIATLERQLALRTPPTFATATVYLGATGGPSSAITFPVLCDGRAPATLDLPSIGYRVIWVGSESGVLVRETPG